MNVSGKSSFSYRPHGRDAGARLKTCRQKLFTRVLIVCLVLVIQLQFVPQAFGYTKSVNTPHRQQQRWNWCGAASGQMVLECDTIANTPGRRRATYPTGTIEQIQQVLWNDIQTHNTTTSWHTDPDGLEWILDHYDPMGHYTQYRESDAAWSCKKLAWTIENYEVPPAILVNSGQHWIVVYRVDSSAAPTPSGTYTINGFNCLDPGYTTGSAGADTYRTYNDFICLFNPVDSGPGDPWDGVRVSVCDPDIVTEELIPPPPLRPGDPIGADEAVSAAHAALDEHGLFELPGFAAALDGAEVAEPVLVTWPFCDVGLCYAVPFTRPALKEEWLLTAVVIVHGATGELMEATYAAPPLAPNLDQFYYGLTYPFTTREASARHGVATPAATLVTDERAIKINFQPPDAVVPYDCLADTGQAFGDRRNGFVYGWNIDFAEGRDRNAHPDQRFDTLIHMQRPSNPHAVWQIALENGTYSVVLVCGDPSYQDQTNNININHCISHPVDPDPWQGGENVGPEFDVYEETLEVTDGLLSIEPDEGAVNAKICFVKITAVFAPLQRCENIGIPSTCAPGEAKVVSSKTDSQGNVIELTCNGAFNLWFIRLGGPRCLIGHCSYRRGDNVGWVCYGPDGEFVKATWLNYEGHVVPNDPTSPVDDTDGDGEDLDTYTYDVASNTLTKTNHTKDPNSFGPSSWTLQRAEPPSHCPTAAPAALDFIANVPRMTPVRFAGRIRGGGQVVVAIHGNRVVVPTSPDMTMTRFAQQIVQNFNRYWQQGLRQQQTKSATVDHKHGQIVWFRNVDEREISIGFVGEPELWFDFSPHPFDEAPDLVPVKSPGNATFCEPHEGLVLVYVKNQGGMIAGRSEVQITFSAGPDTYHVSKTATGPIAPGDTHIVGFPIPTDCWQPDCHFTITVDALNEVQESNESNNSVNGTCIG